MTGLRALMRGRFLAVGATVAIATAAAFAMPALALDSTVFELDGNAVTNHTGTSTPDDWDRVCHSVLGTDCSTTNNANTSVVEFASQTVANGAAFSGGGSKDPIDISSWAYTIGIGGLPGKDALLNGFAARYTTTANAACPSSTLTCSEIFFGMDRFDNSGDAQNGFWFLQNAVSLGSTKSGAGFNFNGVHKNGDVLVVSDFSIGGVTSTISVFKWNTDCTATGKSSNPTNTPPGTCADSNLQLLQSSTAASCSTSASNAAFCGIVNPANGTMSPWSFTDKSGNTTFQAGEFYEGGINLSSFPGLANECFASTIAESRSSTSTSATLKSFVLGGFGACGSATKTHPQDSSGNDISNGSVSIGTGSVQVRDQAVVTVTGTSSYGGSVTFHLCGPADLVSQPTCIAGGTAITVGGLASGAVSPPSPSTVTSDLASVTSAGAYCWRADYSGDSAVGVPASHDASSTECFTVTPVTPSLSTSAGPAVLLGQPVTDTAMLSGAADQPGTPVINPTTAGAAAGGSITFTLFGPNQCTTAAAGTGTNPQTVTVTGNGTYGPVSFTPNAAGTYHWVASYSGNSPNTNPTSHNSGCTDTAEDVVVQVFPTTTVTNPSDVTGTVPVTSPVTFGSSVYDHAVVTGSALAGTPTGTVTFFICNPTQVTGSSGAEVCAAGTQVGSPVTASAIPSSSPPQSQATSTPAVVANMTGVWCFRATYTPDVAFYTGSSDATHDECFTVNDTTSSSSAQNWLPNDTAMVTSDHGAPMNGTLTIQLYDGSNNCTTGAVAGQSYSTTVSNTATATVTSTNTTYKVSFTDTSISWGVTFTSSDPNVASSSHCESSSVTISN